MILYEFLFGYPPFNSDSAQKIFENILHKNIQWHEEVKDIISASARNLMESFIERDWKKRLGSRGTKEIKSHPWFKEVIWNDLNLQEAQFIPQLRDATDTEYFDDRGATDQNFDDEETEDDLTNSKLPQMITIDGNPPFRECKKKDTDFGGFMYRNLPLLEKANQKLVQKLKSDFIGADKMKSRNLLKLRQNASSDFSSHIRKSSSLSRSGIESESESSELSLGKSTRRSRQSSVPLGNRKRCDGGKGSSMSPYATFAVTKSSQIQNSPKLESETRPLDILIAVILFYVLHQDLNQEILSEFLEKLGCRVIQVNSGPEALALALFDIKFDAIFLDSQLSIGNLSLIIISIM